MDFDKDISTKLQQASVGTRWHQFSVVMGVLVFGPLGLWLLIPLVDKGTLSYWQLFPLGALAFAILPLMTNICFPTRQSVLLDAEGLNLSRYGRVPFSNIESLYLSEILTVKRKQGGTILIGPGKHDHATHRGFCQVLIERWYTSRSYQPRTVKRSWRHSLAWELLKYASIGTLLVMTLMVFLTLSVGIILPIGVYIVTSLLITVGILWKILRDP